MHLVMHPSALLSLHFAGIFSRVMACCHLTWFAGKRLREEEADPADGASDKLDSNGAQTRQYRGQRIETPSYPGAAHSPQQSLLTPAQY